MVVYYCDSRITIEVEWKKHFSSVKHKEWTQFHSKSLKINNTTNTNTNTNTNINMNTDTTTKTYNTDTYNINTYDTYDTNTYNTTNTNTITNTTNTVYIIDESSDDEKRYDSDHSIHIILSDEIEVYEILRRDSDQDSTDKSEDENVNNEEDDLNNITNLNFLFHLHNFHIQKQFLNY
jgi:hypothetical protein